MFVNCEIVNTATPFRWEFCDKYAYEDVKRLLLKSGWKIKTDNHDWAIIKEDASKDEYNYLYNLCDHYECMYWND